ncbi:RdgB/HAM1 family non-canonical purine NTP pyrophosphatase [Lysobacter humi (ex Lee et al. 2017)]
MKVVVASGNPGKLAEFAELLAPLGFDCVPQQALGIEDVEETGTTFVENALLKARHAARASGLPALADDSGLCVKALDGAPGLYSARYAGPTASAQANIAKLLGELRDRPDADREAYFHAVIVLLRHPADPQPVIAEGSWHGSILSEPRGDAGFGYDPVFLDPATGRSAAELDPAEKARRSHRGRAVAVLRERLAGEAA